MVKKIGEVKINKPEDPSKEVIKALEDNGFTVIYDFENEFTRFYDIAIEMEE